MSLVRFVLSEVLVGFAMSTTFLSWTKRNEDAMMPGF